MYLSITISLLMDQHSNHWRGRGQKHGCCYNQSQDVIAPLTSLPVSEAENFLTNEDIEPETSSANTFQ